MTFRKQHRRQPSDVCLRLADKLAANHLPTSTGGRNPKFQRLPANSKMTGPLQPLVSLIVPKCWPALSVEVHAGAICLDHVFAMLHSGTAQVKNLILKLPCMNGNIELADRVSICEPKQSGFHRQPGSTDTPRRAASILPPSISQNPRGPRKSGHNGANHESPCRRKDARH